MDRITANAREMYNTYPVGDSGEFGRRLREKNNPRLLELLASYQGGTVYDVGCGTGHWFDAYLRAGIPKEKIIGVDLAPGNVESLRRRGFQAICSDVQDLEIDDDVSDLTISLGVIHITPDPFKAFQELVRITRPGGYIYVSVYNFWHPYYYIVHKATFPIRFCYWNVSKRIVDVVYPMTRAVMQPLSYIVLGQGVDDKIAKAMFMDQVITPRARLFTKSRLRAYAEACGCRVVTVETGPRRLMVVAVLQV